MKFNTKNIYVFFIIKLKIKIIQNYAKKLSLQKENVCLTVNSDNNIYAIGSASHVQLLIADNARALLPPIFIKKDIGIYKIN